MWKAPLVLVTISLSIALVRCEQPATATIEPDAITITTGASVSTTEAASSPPQPSQHSSEPLEYVTTSTTSAPPAEETSTSRSKITYDQRQDGHYNIRADLDIIVIPSNPVAASNLLDLLAGFSMKRSNVNKLYKKNHQFLPKLGLRKSDDLRIGTYLQRAQQRHGVDHSARTGEFFEGRTPYSVDISSSEGDILKGIGHFNDDFHVDVVPPLPYSMQPRHLPSQEWYPSQFFRTFSGRSGDEQRFPKAISDAPIDLKELLTNRVSSDGRSYSDTQDFFDVAIKEPAHGKIGNAYVNLEDISTLPLSDDIPFNTQYETRSASAILSPLDKNWELKLIGASEQCGPGRRRDSYGICQFVPHYN